MKFILDSKIEVGTKVKHSHTKECGIVVHSWYDKEYNWYDNYVLFFGKEFPEKSLKKDTYVLRYLNSSLEIVE